MTFFLVSLQVFMIVSMSLIAPKDPSWSSASGQRPHTVTWEFRQRPATPSGGGPGRAPKGEDSVERGARAGYTGERARSPSIIPSVTSNLGTRLFHSQSVQSHGSCLNGHVHVYVQVFDSSSTFQLTFDRKPSGKQCP